MNSDEKVLNEISNSKWAELYNKKVLNCYPNSKKNCYALYAICMDRFLLVDNLDLWPLFHAAKLLSSKLTLTLFVFSSGSAPFENNNCMLWTTLNKESVLPKKQTPAIAIIKDNKELVKAGASEDYSEDLAHTVKVQEFALFVVKAVNAAYLADLFVSNHPEVNNEDQSFYLNLFNASQLSEIVAAEDRTLWKRGFLNEISATLYKAQTIEEALDIFSKMYFEKTNEESNWFKNLYLKTFFDFLNWEPKS